MSETAPEPSTGHAHPHTPEPNTGKATTGKTNIFTKNYGPLKGWVWVIIIGGTLYLILVLRKKNQAASTASTDTTPDTTTATGSSSDYGASSDDGGSAGGYYGGGGSDSSGMPAGQLNVPIPNSGTATGTSPSSPGFVVSTTVDEGIVKNAGVPLAQLFVGGTTAKGYSRPTDLSADPGLPGEVYVGQAATGAPPGSSTIQGAQRAQTQAEVAQYLAAHPVTGS